MDNLGQVKCVYRKFMYGARFKYNIFYYYIKHDVGDCILWRIYDNYPISMNYLLITNYAFENYFKTKYELRKEKINILLNENVM